MNILLFVMTMLMLLTSLTYARLENFRSHSLLQVQFENYIQNTERSIFNEKAVNLYEKTPVKSKVKGDAADKAPKSNASPRISWHMVVNADARQKDPEAFQRIMELNRKLFLVLYKDQPFFIKAQDDRPNIIDEMIMAIMHAAENPPSGLTLKKTADLANLDLGDALLNDLTYKVFKGLPRAPEPPKKQVQETVVQETVVLAPGDLEEQVKEDSDEFKSDIGYDSLLDYITLRPTKIRLYLAPKVLLLAIVEDETIVNEILELRYNLYREMMNKSKTARQKATDSFKSAVTSRIANLDEALFDFSVTKVNPKDYE